MQGFSSFNPMASQMTQKSLVLDPEGDLLGFSVTIPYTYDNRRVRMISTAKRALDYALGLD